MRILVAEDERLAREELLYLLSRENDLELLAPAVNGIDALERIRTDLPDVVFLDIRMPGLDGLAVASQLANLRKPPLIVFATAFGDYATDAFGVEAVDYLLKPYDEQRLQKTLQRVRVRLAQRMVEDKKVVATPAISAPISKRSKQKLLIDDGTRMIVIDPEKIAYAEKTDKLTFIHMTDGQQYGTRMMLQELEEKIMDLNLFFRSHRSHLVNVECIEEMEPWFNGAYNLKLKDAKNSRIPLSRGSAKELIRRLQGD